jgi:hypothetical protein
MKITASILLALLSPSENPPAVTSESECLTADNLCNAKRFEHQAKRSKTPRLRAGRFYGAYLSYIALFNESGKTEHLCAARRTFERSLSVKGITPQQRVGIEAERSDLELRERSRGAQCKTPVKHSKNEALKLAKSTSSASAPQPPPPAIPPDDTTATPVDPPTIASDTPATRVETQPDPAVLLPVARRPRPTSSPPDRLTSPRPRARVGVGVGLVTVGVGLLAGATAALVGRQGYDEKIATLKALGVHENRDLTMAEMADISAWDARYVRLEKTGAVLCGFAALSVVTAIVVFAVPKRRPVSQARVRSMGAGVHINF